MSLQPESRITVTFKTAHPIFHRVYRLLRMLRRQQLGQLWLAEDDQGTLVELMCFNLTSVDLSRLQRLDARLERSMRLVDKGWLGEQRLVVLNHNPALRPIQCSEPWSLPKATALLEALLSELEDLYSSGACHGNICSKTLAQDAEGRLHLLDRELLNEPLRMELGIAPELQNLDSAPTVQSDAFAIAMVIYGLLSGGREPRAVDGGYLPLVSLGLELPRDVDELLERQLSEQPQRRLSVLEFVQQFSRISQSFEALGQEEVTALIDSTLVSSRREQDLIGSHSGAHIGGAEELLADEVVVETPLLAAENQKPESPSIGEQLLRIESASEEVTQPEINAAADPEVGGDRAKQKTEISPSGPGAAVTQAHAAGTAPAAPAADVPDSRVSTVDSVTKSSRKARNSVMKRRWNLLSKPATLPLGPNALTAISLTASPGTIVLLRGPSGSGKSTLLSWLMPRLAGRFAVGWVSQDPGRAFPPSMTVAEALLLHELADPGAAKVEAETLFGAPIQWGAPVRSLSEGQRQRVSIVREQLRLNRVKEVKNQILFMDEPFGSLDPANHLRLMRDFCSWLKKEPEQRLIVMISHTPEIEHALAADQGVHVDEWLIEG